MTYKNKKLCLLLSSLCLSPWAQAEMEQRLETELALEGRWHPQTAAYPNQDDSGISISLQPEWYAEWARGDYSITLTPFARYDSMDEERSHWDIREFHAQAIWNQLEVRAGISRVFWGKTELLHLVDVINQDDAVENLDGEDKLGQPMLRLALNQGAIAWQAYVLPYFRERTFSGSEGRLRAALAVSNEQAQYQSSREEEHVDYAFRMQGYLGALDYGLAWFKGTNRDPQFVPAGFVAGPNGPQPTQLQAWYGQLEQIGLDAQYTWESWLFKLEAAWRDQSNIGFDATQQAFLSTERYSAATGGFEYTSYGLFDSSYDVGWLMEYTWDERGRDSAAGFQNDLFLAARIAANDTADSTLLGGVVVDLDRGGRFISVEASRRLSGNSKIELELRAFSNFEADDPQFNAISRDDYLQLNYLYYL